MDESWECVYIYIYVCVCVRVRVCVKRGNKMNGTDFRKKL
jgi:hypothetical protein